jgi:hypothetical protein
MATKRNKRFADGGEIDGPDVETSPVYMASAKGEDLPPMEEEPVKAKPKSKMVTKEELAKSGLSLRDYMNKQQGLTRRDGAKPSATRSKLSGGSAGAKGPTAAELDSYKSMPKRLLAPESAPVKKMTAPKRGAASVEDTTPRRGITRINPDDLKGSMKGMGGASGFAKGGSASAARRGDGIASKGKTRGRMC